MWHPQTPSCTLPCRANSMPDVATATLSRAAGPLLQEEAALKPQLWIAHAAGTIVHAGAASRSVMPCLGTHDCSP